MAPSNHPVIVVGGGGAGIIAAWKAASLGAPVILAERSRKLGIKLLISGGGKCNITHAGPMEDVRAAFVRREGRFLKPAFHTFTNESIVDLLREHGVSVYARPDGRIFPVSGRAEDVVGALSGCLEEVKVDVKLNSRVRSINTRDGMITGVVVEGRLMQSTHVVLATGGVSYPKTGTSGDGFVWAQELGHTMVPLRPALAPIGVDPPLPKEWRGIALRGGCLSVFRGERKLADWNGDVLFSHEGISGPAGLEMSRVAAESLEKGDTTLRFDFLPLLEFPRLDAALNAMILQERGKMICTLLEKWLPNRIVPGCLASVGIDPKTRGHVLTRGDRRRITQLLKSWTIGKVSRIDIERGEVTAGGVCLDEIDPHTMRSRKTNGLYICGEVLDIAGPVGGYNLQAAFSTGFVAGKTAGNDWQRG
jgi:predicted Rossmann fold flavoprotein